MMEDGMMERECRILLTEFGLSHTFSRPQAKDG